MEIGLLEDEQSQADLLIHWLSNEEDTVEHSASIKDFWQYMAGSNPDLLILDWELPDGNGLDVINRLRKNGEYSGPVLFLTQRDSEQDIVSALESGADDYLVKPARSMELKARLKSLARRAGINPKANIISLGEIVMDLGAHQVTVAGEPVKLTHKDFTLAQYFLSNPGKLFSREYLLKQVWGVNADLNTRTVDVHISRLRRQLQLGAPMGFCLRNIYQHGYRLEQVDNDEANS